MEQQVLYCGFDSLHSASRLPAIVPRGGLTYRFRHRGTLICPTSGGSGHSHRGHELIEERLEQVVEALLVQQEQSGLALSTPQIPITCDLLEDVGELGVAATVPCQVLYHKP